MTQTKCDCDTEAGEICSLCANPKLMKIIKEVSIPKDQALEIEEMYKTWTLEEVNEAFDDFTKWNGDMVKGFVEFCLKKALASANKEIEGANVSLQFANDMLKTKNTEIEKLKKEIDNRIKAFGNWSEEQMQIGLQAIKERDDLQQQLATQIEDEIKFLKDTLKWDLEESRDTISERLQFLSKSRGAK